MFSDPSDTQRYIDSGILEEFVLGLTSEDESVLVLKMAAAHPEIAREIEAVSSALELYAGKQAPPPDPTIKPLLMATIDYMERIRMGEWVTFPPELHEGSKIEDFSDWINRADMVLPADFEDFHARLIGFTPEVTTAIAWLRYGAPEETHDKQYEKFLVLEGSCEITIGDEAIALSAGSYLSIPLHKPHHVKVTSAIPCKVILQRLAA